MPIEFACDCGKRLKVSDEHAGKRAKCPACKNPVTVPSAAVIPTPPPKPEPAPAPTPADDEDAAFRALSEGPDPASTFNRGWREPDTTSPPPPAYAPPPPPAPYGAKPPDKRGPIPKPKKSKVHDPYEERGRKWEVDWGQIGGGIVGILIGGGLLLAGLANGRFFVWSPIILIGGVIGVLNGLFNVSRE